MKKIFLASAAMLVSLFSFSQTAESFEGKVTMRISYEEVPEEYEPYISMFPKEMTTFIKGKKSCMEQNTMGGGTTTVMDSETGKGFVLMNMMGKKDAYELNTTEAGKTETKPTITYIEETKEIAGYKCKKAEMKFEGEEEPMVIWYTNEIPTGYNPQMQGINGFPMEYTIQNQGMTMVMTVTNVSKETISDSKFELPKGTELKPYSEMLKMGKGEE